MGVYVQNSSVDHAHLELGDLLACVDMPTGADEVAACLLEASADHLATLLTDLEREEALLDGAGSAVSDGDAGTIEFGLLSSSRSNLLLSHGQCLNRS